MKKSLIIISLGFLSTASAAWAAVPVLPVLQANYVAKEVLNYTLNDSEYTLAAALHRGKRHSHLVIVDSRGKVLQNVQSQSAHQLAFFGSRPKSIRLAQENEKTHRLYYLTQPLSLSQVSSYSGHADNKGASTAPVVNDVELSTDDLNPATHAPCGATGKGCSLYSNGNQQLSVLVKFNSQGGGTFDPSKYPSTYFDAKHLTFKNAVTDLPVPISSSGTCSVQKEQGPVAIITQTKNNYQYGVVGQSSPSFDSVMGQSSSPKNQFFLTLCPNWDDNKNMQLQVTFNPGSGEKVISDTQGDLNAYGVQPYASYDLSNFVMESESDPSPTIVADKQIEYTYGFIARNPKIMPSLRIMDIQADPHTGQNFIGGDSGGPIACGGISDLPGIGGSAVSSAGCSEQYQDSIWNNISVYSGNQVVDPIGGRQAIPFYEINKNISSTTGYTKIWFSGHDQYGNPFSLDAFLNVINSKFSATLASAPPHEK